jgi:DNA-binding NarL/FixJ family response regulator
MDKALPTRIVALEDDASFTETLKLVLEKDGEFLLTQAFRNPIHFLGELPSLDAEVFLLDVNLPKLSGVDCVQEIRRAQPGSRIILLTIQDTDEIILQAFQHGADGFILKDDPLDSILEAIRESIRGGAPMSRAISKKVVQLLGKSQSIQTDAPDNINKTVESLLSPKELQVLHLLANGLSYKLVASQLGIGHETVKTHVRHIFEKLNVSNKTEAVSRLFR